ncbi:MAG: PEP-CTERM sorting domain-containing protein [Akkermansia sp.]|nr:PEP-CTERM sorting domain-containing protein [Akkermansia sp.]
MKKTLIALMALAGVAMADEHLAIIAEFTQAPVVAGNCWSGDYVLTFTLAEDYTLQHGGALVGFYRGAAVNDNYGYNAITLGGTNDALTLTVGRGRVLNTLNDATGIGANTTVAYQDNVTFTTAIEKGVTYTLSVTGGNQAMTPTLSWTTAEGIQSETLAAYAGNMNGNAALTYAVNTVMIPEPATATLSLLALAGLAARRRRK